MRQLHGMSHLPIYQPWKGMISRCLNPNYHRYHDYGGRGITVCDRWLLMENFVSDMGDSYSPELQLDRIDNNKGYSPENCRWVTAKQNARNRRDNTTFTVNGVTRCLAEWSEITGIKHNLLWQRLRAGRLPEDIINPTKFHRWTFRSTQR